MNDHALVAQLLDHLNPREVYEQVECALEEEKRSRAKFRERLKPDVKAEFILGDIVVHSPALEGHNATVFRISMLLGNHCTFSDEGTVRVGKALVETRRNDFEPDVNVWLTDRAMAFTADMKFYPAPDLVVEVLSKSTEARDRGVKYEDYLREGVTEYWIVDYRSRRVEQYVLTTGYEGKNVYRKTLLENDARLRSVVLPGFEVPVASLFYQEAFAETLKRIKSLL